MQFAVTVDHFERKMVVLRVTDFVATNLSRDSLRLSRSW